MKSSLDSAPKSIRSIRFFPPNITACCDFSEYSQTDFSNIKFDILKSKQDVKKTTSCDSEVCHSHHVKGLTHGVRGMQSQSI